MSKIDGNNNLVQTLLTKWTKFLKFWMNLVHLHWWVAKSQYSPFSCCCIRICHLEGSMCEKERGWKQMREDRTWYIIHVNRFLLKYCDASWYIFDTYSLYIHEAISVHKKIIYSLTHVRLIIEHCDNKV